MRASDATGWGDDSSFATEAVADSADGLQRRSTEWTIDLLPQAAHIDIDDVRATFVRLVPRAVEQVGSRQDAAGPPHEQLEQRELLRGETQLDLAPARRPCRRIKPKIV